MIIGLQIGKEKSTGYSGKNYMSLLGRQLNEYSLMAAFYCKKITKIYVSTDSPSIKQTSQQYNATVIDRPPDLARANSLTEDVLLHAYDYIVSDLGVRPEIIVLMFANAPTIIASVLEKAITILENDQDLDSCFSVARYNMFSPTRAKKLNGNIIEPFVNPRIFGNVSSIRDSQGDVYFADFSVQILRYTCFENMNQGQPPVKWMGRKTYGLKVEYGFDIDESWQVPVIEKWLREHGFTTKSTPYDLQ